LEREARNRSLGNAGELFVLNFERARLINLGKEWLAEKVEHTSQTRGDGAGFDILSYEETGADRLIEVKTTKYGRETPFFVSRNELAVSESEASRYYLYRLFGFNVKPRLFTLAGAFSASRHDGYLGVISMFKPLRSLNDYRFFTVFHISKLQIQMPVKNSPRQITANTVKIDQSMNAPILCQVSGTGSMSSGTAGYGLTLRVSSFMLSSLSLQSFLLLVCMRHRRCLQSPCLAASRGLTKGLASL
jgi:hypothetical protein